MVYGCRQMARRRRTRRKSHGNWGRRLWGGLSVLLVVVGLGLVGGYLWLRSYLRSDEFLALLNGKTSEVLQADARFSGLDWQGSHVRVPRFEAAGDGMMGKIEAEEFETELSLAGLLRKKFRSSPIIGRRLHLEIDAGVPAPEVPSPRSGHEFPGVQIDALSGRVVFTPEKSLTWSGCELDLQGGSAPGSYDMKLSGGTVRVPVPLIPEASLETVRARYFDGSLFLTEARFGVYESGRMELAGESDFPERLHSVDGRVRDVLCSEVVPPDWKKHLVGRLESDFSVRSQAGGPVVTEGVLVLHNGVVTALPILDRLAAYADTTRFRRMTLNNSRMSYRYESGRLELTDIVISSEGLTRIEGRLAIHDGRLDGEFDLGLTSGTLARIPGAETRVFLPGKEGLLWSPVRISGTIDDPREDLSRRLIAAARERMFEFLPEKGIWVLKQSGRAAGEVASMILQQGTDVTGAGAEIGTGVLEQGTDALKKGAEGIVDGVGGVFDGILGRSPGPEPEAKDD